MLWIFLFYNSTILNFHKQDNYKKSQLTNIVHGKIYNIIYKFSYDSVKATHKSTGRSFHMQFCGSGKNSDTSSTIDQICVIHTSKFIEFVIVNLHVREYYIVMSFCFASFINQSDLPLSLFLFLIGINLMLLYLK